MSKLILATAAGLAISPLAGAEGPGDIGDLDDVARWDMVRMEVCLDRAIDTVPGHPRKLELKLEDGEPVYEFDIQVADGTVYNVECNARLGSIVEIEREVSAEDPVFTRYAKVSAAAARETALAFHPGEVVAMEREVGGDGSVTYEFDIRTKLGYEVKVDVDAVTGEIEEANIEVYEIGSEAE